MAAHPHLGERDIRDRVGAQSFARAEAYFASGAIFDARRQGRTLKARCEGADPYPYWVSATFDVRGVATAECSCPIGEAGRCKHVGALLLTWQHAPDEFAEVESLDAALARRTKAEVVALLEALLRARPEVANTLESLLVAPTESQAQSEGPGAIRRAVAAVFRRRGYGPGAAAAIADELRAMLADADVNDTARAIALYEAAAAAVLTRYRRLDDDDGGGLRVVVNACIAGLARALAAADGDTTLRRAALRALCDVYRFDAEHGPRDAGKRVSVVLATVATADDRAACAAWVRAALQHAEGYTRRVYDGLLLDLEGDAMDDRAFADRCRATGRTGDWVARLLDTGRLAEAAREAARVRDEALLELAARSAGGPREEAVESTIATAAVQAPRTRLWEWLRDRRAARGDAAGVLAACEGVLLARLELADYRAVRAAAQPLGAWETVRPRVLAAVAGKSAVLAAEALLDEGDLAAALAAVRADTARGARSAMVRVQLADALAATQPREALGLYREHVEALIRARGRGNYREARGYVAKARALYAQLGEAAAGEAYIAELRARFRELPALQEEIAAAPEGRP